jgi:hypothetical protein
VKWSKGRKERRKKKCKCRRKKEREAPPTVRKKERLN